jgi:hypothetical protein
MGRSPRLEDPEAAMADNGYQIKKKRPGVKGREAVWQARLVMLIMINIAQMWILSAALEAALAGHHDQLIPLIAASGLCWLIALTIFLWWKPVSGRR